MTTSGLLPLLVALVSIVVTGCQSPPHFPDRPPLSPIFEVLDANRDGVIDPAEVANAGAALHKLDKDGDGQLSYDEVRRKGERELPGDPPPLVAALDVNHDDVIDANEMANAATALKVVDKNSDGQLSLPEVLPPPPLAPRRPFGDMPLGGPPPPHPGR